MAGATQQRPAAEPAAHRGRLFCLLSIEVIDAYLPLPGYAKGKMGLSSACSAIVVCLLFACARRLAAHGCRHAAELLDGGGKGRDLVAEALLVVVHLLLVGRSGLDDPEDRIHVQRLARDGGRDLRGAGGC